MGHIIRKWHTAEIHQVVGDGQCALCNADIAITHWLPMYESKVLDHLPQEDDEYAMMPVCLLCYEPHRHVGAEIAMIPGWSVVFR